MPLHLFDAFGVELEYMIVDQETLDVCPVADRLFHQVAGRITGDLSQGDIDWSNELVRHVIELKTAGPAGDLEGLADRFLQNVKTIDSQLQTLNARLMPSAMHPWMNPHLEMQLWPHDDSAVYETFHRIFDCRGHGWANLQSVHLNLPFCGDDAPDDEFGRLHAAIRLLLPILPGLAASSPVADRHLTGNLDHRLEVYRTNSRRLPAVAGRIIPERAFTRSEYRRRIFAPMEKEISPLDPSRVLDSEFLNARGAIARFERGSIEIRLLDIQECPAADLAIVLAVTRVLKAIVAERWSTWSQQQQTEVAPLYRILLDAIRHADQTVIGDTDYLRLLGWTHPHGCTVGELWRFLIDETGGLDSFPPDATAVLDVILEHGPLARRITRHLTTDSSMQQLKHVYARLCDCLTSGRIFK